MVEGDSMNKGVFYVCNGCEKPCISRSKTQKWGCPADMDSRRVKWVEAYDIDVKLQEDIDSSVIKFEDLKNCAFSGFCDMESVLGGFPNCYRPFDDLNIKCQRYKQHCEVDPDVCPGDCGDMQCWTCKGCVLSKEELAYTHYAGYNK